MTMYDPADFERALRGEASDELRQAARDFRDKVSLQALTGVVMKNPVDVGRSRANWQVTVSSPATGVLEEVDKSGQATIAKGTNEILQAPMDEIVWLTNNVVYIEALENGHSQRQAPNGMVAVTLAEIESQFR